MVTVVPINPCDILNTLTFHKNVHDDIVLLSDCAHVVK